MGDHGLKDFETIWTIDAPWFEAPNYRRKGWSGAIVWPDKNTQWFVKRQENHNTPTWRHPFSGVPTYRREFNNLLFCYKASIPTLELSYYGEYKHPKSHQAILVTRALNSHADLFSWYKSCQDDSKKVNKVMKKLGYLIRDMHDKSFFHYCLYPNHIFVRETGHNIDIRFIDLEKARYVFISTAGRIKDLDCLLRRTCRLFKPEAINTLLDSYFSRPFRHSDKVRKHCALFL